MIHYLDYDCSQVTWTVMIEQSANILQERCWLSRKDNEGGIETETLRAMKNSIHNLCLVSFVRTKLQFNVSIQFDDIWSEARGSDNYQ